jgi:hypothetical protein
MWDESATFKFAGNRPDYKKKLFRAFFIVGA